MLIYIFFFFIPWSRKVTSFLTRYLYTNAEPHFERGVPQGSVLGAVVFWTTSWNIKKNKRLSECYRKKCQKTDVIFTIFFFLVKLIALALTNNTITNKSLSISRPDLEVHEPGVWHPPPLMGLCALSNAVLCPRPLHLVPECDRSRCWAQHLPQGLERDFHQTTVFPPGGHVSLGLFSHSSSNHSCFFFFLIIHPPVLTLKWQNKTGWCHTPDCAKKKKSCTSCFGAFMLSQFPFSYICLP